MSKLYNYKLGHHSLHQMNGGEYVLTFMINAGHSVAPLSYVLNDSEIVHDNRVKEADEIYFSTIDKIRANYELESQRRVIPAVCSLFTPDLCKGGDLSSYVVGEENYT